MLTQSSDSYSQSQWEALLERTIAEIRKLSSLKGGEYAGDSDRLANFRRNGVALGQPPELVWAVYAGKHWDAIQQYCKDLAAGRARQRAEPIAGRLDDLIVYCLLMKAMVEEREGVPGPVSAPIVSREITRTVEVRQLLPFEQAQASRGELCPKTGEKHVWGRADRYTDACPNCTAMRPHQARR